ncbi:MAG: hypothetical protein C5B47_00465 [Verrucomicrobia bacterium]|nr:MAG: hypothetical protein C5B47_00465 [Verrucomicrobiota bacterium]
MRIALVRRGYSATGGAEAYLRRLANGLVQAGLEVVFYASTDWPKSAWDYGEIRRIAAKSPLAFAQELQSMKQKVDCLFSLERILECDVYRAGDGVHKVWLQRRKQFEFPLRYWFRHFLNSKHRQILELEHRMFHPDHTGIIVANSQMVRQEILAHYQFPKERIVLIPNGFEAEMPAQNDRMRIRRQYGFSAEETIVLFTGTGWERKGLRFAVNAVNALRGRAKLLVAGRGPSKAYLSPHVTFAGPVSQMTPLYAAADIFILPTLYDPFSNACLEALSAGLPIITTEANGFSELLEKDERFGNKVPVGHEESLVQALRHWLPSHARDNTRQARLDMAKKFSMKENVRKTLDAIQLSLEIRNKPPTN